MAIQTLYPKLVLLGAALLVLFTMAAYATYFERRISAWIQNRIGPNRVGPYGLLQPLADVLKLLLKEDIAPSTANRWLHRLAPMISVAASLALIGVLPFAHNLIVADVHIGILYILAITSLNVYGITLSGWASNSKYSLLGGLRSSAQLISYEIPMGLAVLSVIIQTGSLMTTQIVAAQEELWNVLRNPLGFLIFLITAFAETNRLPFDLPEAEQELVGGYHTEYSSMKFGMFYVAEYMNMILSSAVIVTLFFGGYLVPFGHLFMSDLPVWAQTALELLAFLLKTSFFVFVYIWVRWTIPRFKYTQLMRLSWVYLFPLSVLNLVLVSLGAMLLG
ncbi:MAG: NADH-quinone oxidoreductase subunit NuoH [Bacteroidetes bacterium]|nr:NADH-quinone oxidoreductase subunit NuoH [Rhodothermia bacterium]MCS7155245.1 NADH-quinone oxidoreductase subunit NuoH [Bacteroidota bacterium]MCX7907830.1 NADH-quinone oxidoreductase subunit NuoH [Bacteroidota bacterium]MDW8138649.1 NADH-quinone oxidoreductase subunit NuoH [Bacteroidota bacterium]MDW8284765.1 NADH-quinone oxidoreductase subunit NuoH [Bacteroidota bacterium]